MNRIRLRRMQLNMTTKELAEKIGTSQSAISMIETGNRIPKIGTIIKLGAALNMSDEEVAEIRDNILKANIGETLGNYIRKGRKAKKLSAQKVCDAIGISRSFLVFIEKGERFASPDKLQALTDLLDLNYETAVALQTQETKSKKFGVSEDDREYIKLSATISDKIDKIQEELGFSSRQDTIIYLLIKGME